MPASGSRYFRPLNRPGEKTGRRYGVMICAIRALAIQGQPISALSFPQWPRRRIGQVLAQRCRDGELRRIFQGASGRGNPPPSIYQLETRNAKLETSPKTS